MGFRSALELLAGLSHQGILTGLSLSTVLHPKPLSLQYVLIVLASSVLVHVFSSWETEEIRGGDKAYTLVCIGMFMCMHMYCVYINPDKYICNPPAPVPTFSRFCMLLGISFRLQRILHDVCVSKPLPPTQLRLLRHGFASICHLGARECSICCRQSNSRCR